MKKLISDKELVAYIDGSLPKEDIRILHSKAVENGDADLLLHLQLATLACDEELTNDLLGEDEFMQDEESLHSTNLAMAAKNIYWGKDNGK